MNISEMEILLLSVFFLSACSESVLVPEEIPIEVLLAAPDTIEIDEKQIILKTYLYRDFMPVSPPDGKSLIAVVMIESVDSSNISGLVKPEAIYIVFNNEVWGSFFEKEIPPDNTLFSIKRVARDGPKWGPGILVDVIVSLNVNNEKKLLQAMDQYIHKTY